MAERQGKTKGKQYARDLEKRLRGVEERFRLFMKNVPEYCMFTMDPEGRIVDWDQGAEQVLGYGSEIVGQPFSRFFPSEDVQSGVPGKELERAIETGRASDERWHIRKDGTYFWAHGATTALRDETGVLKGFAKVLRDGTERKRFEELLNEQNQALEVSERRKDEFLAVLAHELRNLLAPIFNVLAILEDESIPTNVQRKAYGVIGRQVRTLSRLIDDPLDVSRITSGRIYCRRRCKTDPLASK